MDERSRRPTRRTIVMGAGALMGASVAPAFGQDRFPSKTIRIIVPFPAGATTDMLARLFAQRLTETLGQTVVVENVGGAGGSLGADQVAKAPPDGHTLLFHNITFTTTTSSLLFAKRARHDFDDFVPVSVGAYVPMLLLAHPSVPAKDLKEFVAYAKQTSTPLVLRLDRSGQHHASDGRSAETRLRHQDGSRAVPRCRAAGDRTHLGSDSVRRRPIVELARTRAFRPTQADGGRHQVGGAARRAHGAGSGLSQSGTAGLERLPCSQGNAGRGGGATQSGNRRGRQSIRTWSSG